MMRLSPSKVDSALLLIYCSIVPHDYPPFHRVNFVRQLSKHVNVIFIDLPSSFRLNPLSQAIKFYILLTRTLFRFDYSFVWEFFRFQKLHFFILYLYLLFQKAFLKKRIILYTTSGYYDPVYNYIPYDKSIFDCPDIHEGELENNKNWIKKFDLVIVNTKMLSQIVNKYQTDVKIVSSGYLNRVVPTFSQQKIPNSVLFLGGISQRIDYEMLERVIQRLPMVHFYFIGEVYLNKYYAELKDKLRLKKWKKILSHPNVHYLGNFPEIALKSILSFFKVGIIPYDSSDVFNYYSNPIKLYEYLAYGMSVVSTSLPNVTSFQDNFPVYIANTGDEFVSMLRAALRKSDKYTLKYKSKIAWLLKKQSMERKVSLVFREISLFFRE